MKANRIYLVTGAAGFLGGTICRKMIERGERVRAFVLPNDKAMQYVPREAEIVEGDLRDKATLEAFFHVPEGMESIVLHIASVVTTNPDYSQFVMDVNVGGTQNIIDLCLSHKECRRLVYCSSTGAIPETPKGTAIKEVSSFDAEKVLGCYSRSKAEASQLVLDAVRNRGLDAVIVHPSGILGPGDFAVGETTGTVIRIIKGEMPMGIEGSFNLCDVRDLADGTIAAADKGRKGECYILGNKDISFKDFSSILSKEAGCRKVRFFLPIPIANRMARFMEKKAVQTGEKPLMTTFAVYNLARNNEFDSSKARTELGYTTRSYTETIRDEVAWLRKTGKIA